MSIKVVELREYPLKSGKGNVRTTADVWPTGFKHDRIAMLVHADGPNKGKFISQREKGCETLSAVETKTQLSALGVRFSFSLINGVSFDLDINPDSIQTDLEDVKVWGSDCKGMDAGEEAAYYFSEYLGFPVRLVVYPFAQPRHVDPNYSQPVDTTSFADGFPFLITSVSSFLSLSEHFSDGLNVPYENFRPNIILNGGLPWEEDVMHHIRIGPEVELEIVKPCGRCVMTTINQLSGERDYSKPLSEQEPMRTLREMRSGLIKGGLKGVFFGQNAIPRSTGTIMVGDEVEILSTRPMHPALQQAALKFGG